MCRSLKAQELGVVNVPNKAQQDDIENFIDVILDPIREAWGKPITVSSGFRNKAVNKAWQAPMVMSTWSGFVTFPRAVS